MKTFLLKFTGFVVVFLVIISSLIFINRWCANFKVAGENSILVVGHSHSACAINDEVIPTLINKSNPGESYLYNYLKTRKLLEQNPHINTLMIEFSNDQFSAKMNRWTWEDEFLLRNFPKYGTFSDLETIRFLNRKNPKSLTKSFSYLMQNNLKMLFLGLDYNKNNIGGFNLLEGSNVAQKIEKIEEKRKLEKDNSFPVDNLRYLEQMIDFALKREVNVYLIRSPLHHRFLDYENLDNEDSFQRLAKELSEKYEGLKFLDFGSFPIPDEGFKDLGHLNKEGAAEFSGFLSSWISSEFEKELLVEGVIQK